MFTLVNLWYNDMMKKKKLEAGLISDLSDAFRLCICFPERTRVQRAGNTDGRIKQSKNTGGKR